MIPGLEQIPALIGVICAGYLACRLAAVLLRTRWARRAYTVWPASRGSRGAADGARRPAEAGDDARWLDRCRGALVGAAVGDALGMPAESLPAWLVRLRYPGGARFRRGLVRIARRAGDISDDTQLTVAVARSIDPAGRYVHGRFLDELRLWHGFRLGAGRACTVAARRLARDLEADSGQPSEGNGAAIRVVPLAIAGARAADHERLAREVALNARATHASEVAAAAALLVARLVQAALRGEHLAVEQLDSLAGQHPQLKLAPVTAARAPSLAAALAASGTAGHAPQTAAAVLALLAADVDLAGAMEALHRVGGDVDSIGAIVGAVVGARRGLSGLPERWTSRVQHRDVLLAHADRLARPRPAISGPGEVVETFGDVAQRGAEVIVNAWNRNIIPAWMLLPQGVSRAIRKAGGKSAIRAIAARGPLPLGAAWETGAGDLPARWVVHVAGINLAWRGSERSVRWSTRNALLLARCLGARTVAMPLIGSGSGGFSEERAVELMRAEIDRQATHFERVELVRYGEQSADKPPCQQSAD